MVMKGAITLLGESNDKAFIAKQKARLEKAADEMNEFVHTLLSLTKIPGDSESIPRRVSKKEITEIVEAHRHLLNAESVVCEIIENKPAQIRIPDPVFKILLGNLLKNAFAHTAEGSVKVILDENKISIIDTGNGFHQKRDGFEGYGLGLLLVKDICRQFECSFSLVENTDKGCTATVNWEWDKNTQA